MMVNNLSNHFVNAPQLGYKRSNRESLFSRMLSNVKQDCDKVFTSVLYLRTENTLYSGSLGGTQTVYAEYTLDSTNEDPVAQIRGNNHDGEFDFICHINDIDPTNASYAEMCALFGHLQKTGQIPSEANLYKVSVKSYHVFTKQESKVEAGRTAERTDPQLRRFVLSA